MMHSMFVCWPPGMIGSAQKVLQNEKKFSTFIVASPHPSSYYAKQTRTQSTEKKEEAEDGNI